MGRVHRVGLRRTAFPRPRAPSRPRGPSEDGAGPPLPRILGPALLGVAIGIDALLAGLVLLAPPDVAHEDLTVIGIHNFRPERDAPIYLGAGALSVVAAIVLGRLRPARRYGIASPRLSRWLPVGVAGICIAAATVVFLQVRVALPLSSSARLAHLGLSMALAAVCTLVAKGTSRPWTVRPGGKAGDVAVRPRVGWLDLVTPLGVFALLYLPGWRHLAGNAFYSEGSLHLDFFGFGPALAFRSGAALGTELHPYYGLGWGVVLSRLDPLSYGHIIRFEVLYGCLYFSGVYLLLRLLVSDRRWASAGTILAVLFQLFVGFPTELLLWRFPSATVMRWPFDVWFFVACLLYLRTRHTRWAVAAGVLVALGVVFETDTGVALALAFGFFWICLWRTEGTSGVRPFAWTAGVSGFILVAGLGIASRWTLLSGSFWHGWTENLRVSARGGTLLPLTGATTGNITAFVVLTTAYLTVVVASVLCVVRRRVSTSTVMVGCIALYGFFTFLYFVGRSHPSNLFRPTVPFALLIAAAGGLAHRAVVERHRNGHRGTGRGPGAVAWAAFGLALALLVANPGVRAYPGLIRSAAADRPARGICLYEDPDDVCGLPPEAHQPVADLHALAARLRTLGSSTAAVAVLDQTGPVIQHLAGARPWGRYLPLFPTLVTRAQVRVVARDLRENPPALVVMRVSPEGAPPFIGFWWEYYVDTWRELRGSIESDFLPDSRIGPYEIWRRPPR